MIIDFENTHDFKVMTFNKIDIHEKYCKIMSIFSCLTRLLTHVHKRKTYVFVHLNGGITLTITCSKFHIIQFQNDLFLKNKNNIVLELNILRRSYVHEYKYELNLLFYLAGQLHIVDGVYKNG